MERKSNCGHASLRDSCPKCRALKDYWESKLSSENLDESTLQKQEYYSKTVQYLDELDGEAKQKASLNQDYYLIFERELIREKASLNHIEFLVLQGVLKGKKYSSIIKWLREFDLKVHRETAKLIVRRAEFRWGLRRWTEKQLYPKIHLRKTRAIQFSHTLQLGFQILTEP